MEIKEKILKKYNEFYLTDCIGKKNRLRIEIKGLSTQHSNLDSRCYHVLGLIDFESDD